MKDKKDIDRLFQEKFRDFEEDPKEQVWRNIEAKLDQGKPLGTVLPLWLKIAGSAAALALLFLLIDFWFSSPPESPAVTPVKLETKDFQKPGAFKNNLPELTKSGHSQNRKEISPLNNSNQGTKKGSTTARKGTSDRKGGINSAKPSKEKRAPGKSYRALRSIKSIGLPKIPVNQDDSPLALHSENIAIPSRRENEQGKDIKDKKEPNALEEIAEQENNTAEENNKENKPKNRFSLRPHIAPIYYGSISSGSAIDPEFKNNNNRGETTLAYGIDIAYALSDRVKIRTGISRVKMAYETKDVGYTAAPQMEALAVSSRKANLKGLQDNPATESLNIFSTRSTINPEAKLMKAMSSYTEGELNQELEYIEVPFEIEYAVLNKRFGISLIGGASTLFRSDDAIQLKSRSETTKLGKAANLNSVSFTTNIGFGLNYRLNPKLSLNVEPMFKYQLNGFNGETGGFDPYYFGVYSGLRFRF